MQFLVIVVGMKLDQDVDKMGIEPKLEDILLEFFREISMKLYVGRHAQYIEV